MDLITPFRLKHGLFLTFKLGSKLTVISKCIRNLSSCLGSTAKCCRLGNELIGKRIRENLSRLEISKIKSKA